MEEELLKMSVNARCVGCKEPTKFVAGFYDGSRGEHGCFYDCENEACAVNQILRCAESKEAQKMMQIQEDNGRLGMYAGEIAALRKDVGLTIMQMSQMAGCSRRSTTHMSMNGKSLIRKYIENVKGTCMKEG